MCIILLSCLTMVASAQQYLYWYDGNVGAAIGGNVASNQMHIDADVTGLPYGFHTLTYALLSSDDGSVTDMRFVPFFKAMSARQYVYWFDNATDEAVVASASSNIIHVNANMSGLPEGLHMLTFAMVGEDGGLTDLRFVPFVTTASLAADNLHLVYSIDDGDSFLCDSPQAGENHYVFHIDVASLAEGEHTISYMLTDGKYTYATGQATFTKTEISSVGVVTFGKNADSPFYNLNGVEVEQARKGLYISNGRKIILK